MVGKTCWQMFEHISYFQQRQKQNTSKHVMLKRRRGMVMLKRRGYGLLDVTCAGVGTV